MGYLDEASKGEGELRSISEEERTTEGMLEYLIIVQIYHLIRQEAWRGEASETI